MKINKFTSAINAIPFIGLPCLIFDSCTDQPTTEALIEGVDIIADKIICERANFEPHQIGVLMEEEDFGKIVFNLLQRKNEIESFLKRQYGVLLK